MKIMQVKILDATHLELRQPLAAQPGDVIVISIPDAQDDEQTWHEATRQHFLEAYDDQDTIYDE